MCSAVSLHTFLFKIPSLFEYDIVCGTPYLLIVECDQGLWQTEFKPVKRRMRYHDNCGDTEAVLTQRAGVRLGHRITIRSQLNAHLLPDRPTLIFTGPVHNTRVDRQRWYQVLIGHRYIIDLPSDFTNCRLGVCRKASHNGTINKVSRYKGIIVCPMDCWQCHNNTSGVFGGKTKQTIIIPNHSDTPPLASSPCYPLPYLQSMQPLPPPSPSPPPLQLLLPVPPPVELPRRIVLGSSTLQLSPLPHPPPLPPPQLLPLPPPPPLSMPHYHSNYHSSSESFLAPYRSPLPSPCPPSPLSSDYYHFDDTTIITPVYDNNGEGTTNNDQDNGGGGGGGGGGGEQVRNDMFWPIPQLIDSLPALPSGSGPMFYHSTISYPQAPSPKEHDVINESVGPWHEQQGQFQSPLILTHPSVDPVAHEDEIASLNAQDNHHYYRALAIVSRNELDIFDEYDSSLLSSSSSSQSDTTPLPLPPSPYLQLSPPSPTLQPQLFDDLSPPPPHPQPLPLPPLPPPLPSVPVSPIELSDELLYG